MIRKLEEMCMNAWPAINSMVYDGWIIRFAKGYSRRSNSVNAVYLSKEDIHKKIQEVEKIYQGCNQRSIFKITPEVFPEDLDKVLQGKGYAAEAETSVQLLDLNNIEQPRVNNIVCSSNLNDKWLNTYCELNSVQEKNKQVVAEILSKIIPNRYFVMLMQEDKVVACGLGVMEDGYLGLFDIVVHADYRGKGYGEQLLLNIISLAKAQGAKTAYLQVMLNNPAALRLYEKLGFKELYTYWYRVKSV